MILYSQNKFHQYFGPYTIFFMVIDLDTTRNVILFYCYLATTIYCLHVFFGLVFKLNLKGFQKRHVLKVGTRILLKLIGSGFAKLFIQ